MDHLPDLLDRLLDQFIRLEWKLSTHLQPGLSTEAIEAQLHALPFHLPQEVYTLYQWRNGDRTDYTDLFPLARFLPLEEAIAFYQDQIQISQIENEGEDLTDWYWKPGWFPVFQWDYKVYHVVLGQETPAATAPMLYYDPEGNYTFRYPSLTQLLQIVVECYETGAYLLEGEGDYRSLQEDQAKVAAILRNALPEQADAVLTVLKEGLPGPAFETALQDVVRFLDPRAIEPLLALVQNPPTSEQQRLQRLKVIYNLPWVGDARVMELLTEAVRTGESAVRREALGSLSRLAERLNHPLPTEPLLIALEDPDPQVQHSAARLLSDLDDPRAVPVLQDWLQAEDRYHGWLVATLARFGDAQAVALAEALLQLRQAERFPNERTWLAQELGKWNDPRAVELLRPLLQDSVLSVRTAAAQALVQRNDLQVADTLIQLVQTALAAPEADAANFPQWALEALARWHDPRLEEVIAALLQHPAPQARRVTVEVLQESEASWRVPYLLYALVNDDPSVRADAVIALGKRQATEALVALVERLQDEDSYVRSRAAQALGRLGDTRAAQALVGALADPVREVQVRAIYALAELQDQRAREPLRPLAEAPDEMVRRSARWALAHLEQPTSGGQTAGG